MSETKVPLKKEEITPKVEVEVKANPKTLKDTTKNHRWEMLGQTQCVYTQGAIRLLKYHGESFDEEKDIKYIDTPNTAWKEKLFSFGASYTPLIFRDGKVFGSYGELETYYKRTFVPLQD